uniref:Uncharacterized protein n=1 Tax=Panagrellus redivivus TaxID=6233 RepID=A0A7E4VPE8_PANRE
MPSSSKAPEDENNNIPDHPPSPMEEDPHPIEDSMDTASPLIQAMMDLSLVPVEEEKLRERRQPGAEYDQPLIRQSPIKFLCRCKGFMDRIAMPPPVSTSPLKNQVLLQKKQQRERRVRELERTMSPRKLKLKRKRSASEALAALLRCMEMTKCPYCKKDNNDDDDMNGGGGFGPSVGGGASRRVPLEAKFDFAC